MDQAQINALFLEIWKAHPSFQKWLMPDEADKAEIEMMAQLNEAAEIWDRTFGE